MTTSRTQQSGRSPLHSGRGTTTIQDAVVSNIAAMAIKQYKAVVGQAGVLALGAPAHTLSARGGGGKMPGGTMGLVLVVLVIILVVVLIVQFAL